MARFPQKRLRADFVLPRGGSSSNRGGSDIVDFSGYVFPDDVLDCIISFVPIKEAFQIGATANRFRDTWMLNRNLIFDLDFCRSRNNQQVIGAIDRVLRGHRGREIRCLRISINLHGAEGLFNKWIEIVAQKGLRVLDLDFPATPLLFKLDSEIFDLQSLVALRINLAELPEEVELNGFSLLRSLVLRKVNMSASLIQEVFSNCLMLEYFELMQCLDIQCFAINAHNLKHFKWMRVGFCPDMIWFKIVSPTLRALHYYGNIGNYLKIETPNVKNVMLHIIPSRRFTKIVHLRGIVTDLAHIHHAYLTSTIVEVLSAKLNDGQLTDENYMFPNLKELQLFMDTTSFCNPYDVVSFLTKCPCLEKFLIDVNLFTFPSGPYWELHQKQRLEQFSESFDNLIVVKVVGFKYQNMELDLIRFFLLKAKFLVYLLLVTPKNWPIKGYSIDTTVYLDLLKSWRSNPDTYIQVLDHDIDASNRRTAPVRTD